MRTHFDILALGTAFIDDFIHVEHYPAPDHKAEILREDRQFGGIAATAMAAASRLGANCAYAGYFGPDELSASMLNGFAEVGVDCSMVLRDPAARPGHSIIVVDDTARTRNIFYNLRGTMPLAPADVTEKMIASARVLFFDHWGHDANIAAGAIAQKLGVPVVADVEWTGIPRAEEMIALIDHLLISTQLAHRVTGLNDWAQAALALPGAGQRACTGVTVGDKGCYYVLKGEKQARHCPAYKVQVVETTGCGDVFHGAYAAALAAGRDVAGCIQMASAAAAVYASRPSGWRYLATPADIATLQS